MQVKKINIEFYEYSNIEELESQDRELARGAIEALDGSYAPYSEFNVGACLRLSDGSLFKGANQENIAYPSGLCAERTALFSAGALYPNLSVESIAIVGRYKTNITKLPTPPCGACRQVMAEYETKAGKPISVLLIGLEKILKFNGGIKDLLPLIFSDFASL